MALANFSTHLPVLQVMVPLTAAALCALTPRPVIAWGLTLLAGVACLAGALRLLTIVLSGGPVAYHLGGWPPPLGIEFRLDALSAFMLVIVSAVGAITFSFSRQSVAREIAPDAQPLFYAMLLLCFGGLMGVVSTGDAFNLFVFLEIASLPAYVLVAMGAGRDKRALTAAFTYLVMGTIGASFYVIGLGLIYMMTGALNMTDIAGRIAGMGGSRTIQVAFAFIITGLGLKLAMFPLHLWLPNAYTYAPSAVSGFLAGTAGKVALYVIIRFLYTVFGPSFEIEAQTLKFVFLPLGMTAIVAASAVAIFQTNVKRMLAWSSIAQAGYLLAGISFANVSGLMASILHLFNHALMKSGLFLAVGCVIYRTGSCSIASFRGLGHQMPWTMAAFVIGALSLIGVPATVGFSGKWYLVLAAFERGWWPVAVVMAAGSALTLIYVWRVIEAAYFHSAPEGQYFEEAPPGLLAPLWLLMITCLALGIDSEFTVTASRLAADSLFLEPHAGLPAGAAP